MRNTPVDFSIVIPTYNRADSLPRTIKSVLDQRKQGWELIVVDDGSDDGTRDLMKNYSNDTRIRYIYQQHQGVSVARNTGVNFAEGSNLIFLDSDDIFFPDLIEMLSQKTCLEYDLICWEVRKLIDGRVSLWQPENLGKLFNNIKATFLAGSVCYRKDLFMKAGGYDPKMSFGENYELGIRISQFPDLKIIYLEEPLMQYTVDTQNRTSNLLMNRFYSHVHQFKKHREKYDKDRRAKATMSYLIAFTLEKLNRKTAALKYYKSSWVSCPWRTKPFLKILYLSLLK